MAAKDTRLTLENLEIQRFFWAPSFEIYNGVAGLYDQGPAGYAIEKNLLNKWREHFILEDDMLEVRCSMLTPYKVLEASGHTAKFNDFLVNDTVIPNNLYRADQLIEKILATRLAAEKNAEKRAILEREISNVGDYGKQELIECIQKFEIKSPDGNPLSDPVPFNLMFNTRIGPGANSIPGFLRPETAQGIFVNFPRLYEYNRCQLPFATAQIGVAYRNEIAPRNGLVRCREFQMAEIEHFCDPDQLNNFPKFASVSQLKVQILSAPAQEEGKPMCEMTLEQAVKDGIICHQTHGYYMGRTYIFIKSLGIDHEKIRFRQHRIHEKAHYSRDCWDLEIYCLSTESWLECAGIADRQSFDLTQHAKTSGKGTELNPKMIVKVPLEKPITEDKVILTVNKKVLGQSYKKRAGEVSANLENLSDSEKESISQRFEEAEKLLEAKPVKPFDMTLVNKLSPEIKSKFEELTTIEVAGDKVGYEMVHFEKKPVTVTTRQFIPNVIEPSFGVGRIMTVLMEHAFYLRQMDGQECRRVLKLPPFLAPVKATILPLSGRSTSEEQLEKIKALFKKAKIPIQVDSSSATVGKRYSRADELGTPFAITMDFQTNTDETVTLRERDSMKQVRGKEIDILNAIRGMVDETDTWEAVQARFPAVVVKEDE